jgi:hypothetical protein
MFVLLALTIITAVQVCASQSNNSAEDAVPRTLEVLDVGYKLPLEIVAVRNLQKREHWMRDLEIEIKNVSGKPIYETYFTLFIPADKDSRGASDATGASYAVNLHYGRLDLFDPSQRPSTEDQPLRGGDTTVLKVGELLWKGYEYHLARENPPEEKSYSVRVIILSINFGDGTGFTHGGVPYPREAWMKSRPQRYIRITTRPE